MDYRRKIYATLRQIKTSEKVDRKIKNKLSRELMSLNTGPYYKEFSEWASKANDVLAKYEPYGVRQLESVQDFGGFRPYTEVMNTMNIQLADNVFFNLNVYKMPSGSYEVVGIVN